MDDSPDIEDRWPQRSRFRELLEQWIATSQKSTADFAGLVGMSKEMIYGYRSRRNTLPPADLLVAFAHVLECDITELISNPHGYVGGQDLSNLTDSEKHLAEMMFKKYKDPGLTSDDRQYLYEDFLRSFDRLKAMKERHLNS